MAIKRKRDACFSSSLMQSWPAPCVCVCVCQDQELPAVLVCSSFSKSRGVTKGSTRDSVQSAGSNMVLGAFLLDFPPFLSSSSSALSFCSTFSFPSIFFSCFFNFTLHSYFLILHQHTTSSSPPPLIPLKEVLTGLEGCAGRVGHRPSPPSACCALYSCGY